MKFCKNVLIISSHSCQMGGGGAWPTGREPCRRLQRVNFSFWLAVDYPLREAAICKRPVAVDSICLAKSLLSVPRAGQ
jgi:hypothetical protein